MYKGRIAFPQCKLQSREEFKLHSLIESLFQVLYKDSWLSEHEYILNRRKAVIFKKKKKSKSEGKSTYLPKCGSLSQSPK